MMGGGVEKAREQAQMIAQADAMRGHLAYARIAINVKDTSGAECEMNAAIWPSSSDSCDERHTQSSEENVK